MYQVTPKSTVHGANTPYGNNTPHRFPTFGIASLTDIMSILAIQLYPTGRAFYMPKGGIADNTHLAFNKSFIRLINDADSTIDSTFPDNDNFDANDCDIWEYRFGIVTNSSLSLSDRRKAIYRKGKRSMAVLKDTNSIITRREE